ncbi:proline-rich early nodulin-like protein [Ophiostoma piceae UAMH 11346]|uniref:Proline-rich early nodulin-like protein n=1 Tax=Ophiostoma piceae (strain UAMH 11346) TaxID=1262450 RepID=S3BPJ4_OPHP1|nr:proline-rich early nodulin-like protein [Ophiostoma piceae UAMH 11346]
MEASSPLSSAWSPHAEDDHYGSDASPVAMVEAPVYRMEAVHIELTPRSERSFVATSVAPAENPTRAAPEACERMPTKSQQKPVTEEARPPTNETSTTSSVPGMSHFSSLKVEIGPVPRSYTANIFSLAPPSTPPPALSDTVQSEHKLKTASIPETPEAPDTPGLSEVAETPTSSQAPASQLPGSRERSRQTSIPSTPKMSGTKDSASTASTTSTPKGAGDANGTNGTNGTNEACKTTRSGRQVVRPKNVQQDLTPSPPSTKAKASAKISKTASKLLGKASTTISAVANAATNALSPTTAASPTVTTAVMRRRKAEAARWKTGFLLTDARSPLNKFDLRSILLRPETWDALSLEDQTEVLALFPSMANVSNPGTDMARPNISSLINDNNFRHDCARYQNDLADGFFEREWLAEAFEAHAMRNSGVFDEHVINEFETAWGVTVPETLRRSTKKEDDTSPTDTEVLTKQETRNGEADTAREETPTTPTPKRRRAVSKKPQTSAGTGKPAEGQANGKNDKAISNGDGDGPINGASSAPNAKDEAAEAAEPITATTAPREALSLRLGSPLASESGDDVPSIDDGTKADDTNRDNRVQVEEEIKVAAQPERAEDTVDATKSSSAKTKKGSHGTRKAPVKRKATKAPTQRGRKRRSPNVEVREVETDGAGGQGSQEDNLEQPANITVAKGTLTTE